jgi:hypothetical protein
MGVGKWSRTRHVRCWFKQVGWFLRIELWFQKQFIFFSCDSCFSWLKLLFIDPNAVILT